ncbi:urease accessory protein UreH domain-containing protein [Mangrovibacterium lignilyticum]|uniref:urease accessory protein UreH domain-containing protein n=1 Tax=Mangrovibacterium lignilyticum TaxID=2668052 RepID=UPI0013CFBA50|nr:sulfite exporter TauE/SafE family protein [Mangrovibacterium lignilyticum]
MNELYLLAISALSLGFIHTLLGPDHYLPFIVISKARNWSTAKTMRITFVSGIGHVGSSVLIGMIGIALGSSLSKLEGIETFRGELVGWLLFAFGLAYTFFGIYKYMTSSHHAHLPAFLMPKNVRENHHLPTNEEDAEKVNITPWIIFLIFVFGPCEVLIPLLIFPAYSHSAGGMALISSLFAVATITTMMTIVFLGHKGVSRINFKKQERYVHLLAGVVILISGAGMVFLGW